MGRAAEAKVEAVHVAWLRAAGSEDVQAMGEAITGLLLMHRLTQQLGI
jgi:hypothetical protein